MIRDQLVSSLQANIPQGFRLSQELPWTSANEPLYVKNKKVVYVDAEDTSVRPLLGVIGGADVMQSETEITVWFSTDAKSQPAQTQQLVDAILEVKNIFTSHFRRQVIHTVDFQADTKIYQFEINLVTIPNQGAQQ